VLFYSQVLDALIAPVLAFLLLRLTASRRIMGEFGNGLAMNVLGWVAVGVLLAADVATTYSVGTNGIPG
jgi:Mn2+/Fe2+ NRAMP family transporter